MTANCPRSTRRSARSSARRGRSARSPPCSPLVGSRCCSPQPRPPVASPAVCRNNQLMDEEHRAHYERTGESEHERLTRNMNELLQELRVSQTGVQILFAFLLALPFAQRFNRVTTFERDVYSSRSCSPARRLR